MGMTMCRGKSSKSQESGYDSGSDRGRNSKHFSNSPDAGDFIPPPIVLDEYLFEIMVTRHRDDETTRSRFPLPKRVLRRALNPRKADSYDPTEIVRFDLGARAIEAG